MIKKWIKIGYEMVVTRKTLIMSYALVHLKKMIAFFYLIMCLAHLLFTW